MIARGEKDVVDVADDLVLCIQANSLVAELAKRFHNTGDERWFRAQSLAHDVELKIQGILYPDENCVP